MKRSATYIGLMATTAIAVGLAACTGGDDGIPVATHDQVKEERDTAVEERDTAVEERDTAVEERDTAVDERDTAVDAKDDAEKELADKAVADKAVADKAVADKAVADKAVADKAVADKAVADALAAQVTQIDPADDMVVTPVRDSDSDIKAVKVGETSIPIGRHSAFTGSVLATNGVKIGARYEEDGIEVTYVDSLVGTVPEQINDMYEATNDDVAKIQDGDARVVGAAGDKHSLVSDVDNGGKRVVPKAAPPADDSGKVVWINDEGEAQSVDIWVEVDADPDTKGDQTKYYRAVDLAIDVNKNGDWDRDDDYYNLVEVEFDKTDHKSKLELAKAASDFEHLSYGVWGEVDSKNKLTGVGAGFLIAHPSMKTPVGNVPVTGTATFEGQYSSHRQSRGSGKKIDAVNGDATLTANFGRESMDVTLADQFGTGRNLILTGTIDGNGFSGTGMGADTSSGGYLVTKGASAKMEGAFYGPKVNEAGGVYDVQGGSAKNPGRVVGSFGGVNTDN